MLVRAVFVLCAVSVSVQLHVINVQLVLLSCTASALVQGHLVAWLQGI